MQSPMIDTIMLSEKRRSILLLLIEGSKSSEEIKNSLGGNWRLLKQPMKELKEEGFIVQDDSTYSLTNIGKIMLENA